MVLPFNLLERVAHGLQKDLIRIHDRAIHVEFDHGLRSLNRRDLADVIEFQSLSVSHIFPGDDIALGGTVGRRDAIDPAAA